MARHLSIVILIFLRFWIETRSESLAEYDQPTIDPAIFILDEEDFPQGSKEDEKESANFITSKEDVCLSDGYYADKEDCSLFHLCQKSRVYQFQCGPGLAFDPRLDACNWKSSAGKACESPVTVKCPSLKYFGDPENATVFYRCVGSQKVTFQCPPGLVFNVDWSVCDRPKSV